MTNDLRSDSTVATGRDLQEALDRLVTIEGDQGPILSVYVVLDPKHDDSKSIRPRLKNLLSPIEMLAASGALGHQSSIELRNAADEALAVAMAASLDRSSSQGVALFHGLGAGLRDRLDLPVRVWDCATVGPVPYLRPLRAALQGFHRTVAVTLDARRAEISTFDLGHRLDREVLETEELRKTNLAGWYGLDEQRNRQHAEEARDHLFREVAELLGRMRRERDIDLVLLGGRHEVTRALLPFLEPELRAMTETFVIDLHTLTPEILAARVAEIESSRTDREDARQVEEVYTLEAEGGLGVVGIDAVLDAASRHAISRLLIHDGAMTPGATCTVCGTLSHPQEACAVCGGRTRAVADLLEELARAVVDAGGTVGHVMADTPLADGVVAARLRFRG